MAEQQNDNGTAESPRSPWETFVFHQRRALEETAKALEALLPEGFREHGQEAGREVIKGFKVLVDAAIDEIEKATAVKDEKKDEDDDSDRPSTTGKVKVRVDLE